MRSSESKSSLQQAQRSSERTNVHRRVPAQKEWAFLVGIEYRTRSRAQKKSLTSGAQAAHDTAVMGGASQPSSVPVFSAEESLDEFALSPLSAGAEIAGEFLQRRDRPDAATLIGKGKLEEIAGAAASVSADLILFDHDLTASQQRNIEKIVNVRVIDRTQLILDIFAKHARTREGQLQVEFAQLEYMLPRLAGRGIEMSQLGGGIGTRGPGETQLETDRRKIHRRVRHVKEQIENVRRVRTQQRQRRESIPVATVALVGYTNAGKSTLFNALTNASPRVVAHVCHARSHHSQRHASIKAADSVVRHRRFYPQFAAYAGHFLSRHTRGSAKSRARPTCFRWQQPAFSRTRCPGRTRSQRTGSRRETASSRHEQD